MNARLFRKTSGQSIPLIAMMIVILFAMVGLSVDVGNTYAEQRNVVRASNAAALAGMDLLIKSNSNDAGTDQNVAKIITTSLQSNGIKVVSSPDAQPGPGERLVSASYLGPDGNPLVACSVGQCGTVPAGVSYIKVDVSGVVDTYFARVVGRATLPVKATSFVARCLPVNGVYPMAVWNSDLGPNGFIVPKGYTPPPSYNVNTDGAYTGTYSDQNYKNKTWRRIFLKDDSVPGSFSFLRWNDDPGSGSATNLAHMMADDGSLSEGFKEVTPWPDQTSAAPPNYPLAPGQLSIGDWVLGNPGLSWGGNSASGVREAMINHMNTKTVMIFPIVEKSAGNGNNGSYKIARLGAFYIVDPDSRSNVGGVGVQGGNNAYVDLVYLGPANETACLQTNVEPITNAPGGPTPEVQPIRVKGQTFVKPRWASENSGNPVSYQLILDVSGSMTLDFYGASTIGATHYVEKNSTGGTDYWCSDWDNPNNSGSAASTLPPKYDCKAGGDNATWRKYQERRIYIAKYAIYQFINALNSNDTMRVIAFSSNSGMSGNAQAFPSSGWTNDKAQLIDAVKAAGAYASDPYRSVGGTPSGQGLKKARDIMSSSSAPKVAPNGKTYKNVVIFLTDGMANVFMNGQTNYADDICSDVQPREKRLSIARCQVGTTNSGMLRPIDAMIDEANKIKAMDENTVIYAIGLAGVDPSGLPMVASSPDTFYTANQPNVVDDILLEIKGRESAPCVASGASGTKYYDKIAPENQTNFPPPNDLPPGTLGYVYLYDEKDNPLPSGLHQHPITHDPVTGKMTWSLPEGMGLPPGNYILRAWVGYKAEDGVSRVYDTITNQQTLQYGPTMSFSVSYDNILGNELIISPVYLDYTKNVCP